MPFLFLTSPLTVVNFFSQSQYVLCHYALLEAITFGNTEIAVPDIRIKVAKLGQRDPSTGKTGYRREFEV